MKKYLFMIAILSVITVVVNAQTYGTTHTPAARDYEAVQSQQATQSYQTIQTGKAYNGTVYEPFSSATPSEYSEVGGGSSTEDNKPEKHIRRFDIGGDSGQGPSPVGDAILPMLLFAAAFMGVIYLRRRKTRA